MERTEQNILMVESFLQDYETMRRGDIESSQMARLKNMLSNTYFSACKTPNSAYRLHAAVMDNEEFWPRVATLRRHMRELNLVELDRQGED